MSAIAEEISPKELIAVLLELQNLEFAAKKNKKAADTAKIESLRSRVPEVILGHHDRLVAKNKKSVVAVHNNVCGGCFLALPGGEKARIALARDLHICQSCGRYLYVEEQ